MNYATATIKSSGRQIRIIVTGNEFWYVSTKQGGPYPAVSGPFALTDPRFIVH